MAGNAVAATAAPGRDLVRIECRMTPMVSPIDAIRSVLNATAGIRLAVLFGSAARHGAERAHDLDVGVCLTESAACSVATLAVALERAAGRRVDLAVLDAAPPLLRFEVARDGMVLVEGADHAWADFRARAMIDWWDWAPTARLMHRVMAERVRAEATHGAA
jgi:predicted nucleotidyltransferase